jgi:hypothetical protein
LIFFLSLSLSLSRLSFQREQKQLLSTVYTSIYQTEQEHNKQGIFEVGKKKEKRNGCIQQQKKTVQGKE